MQVEYAKLDPFNISFYDRYEKKIYLDECVKGSELEKELIEHEKKHADKFILFEPLDFHLFPKVLKYKPLHALQFLFPFVMGRKKDGSWIFKVDLLGLLILGFLIVSLSILLTYRVVVCEIIESPFGVTYPSNCKVCSIFGCKNITQAEYFRLLHP